jgi:hypothetical protein
MRKGTENPGMQSLHLLQTSSGKRTLRWRPLIHPDTDEDFAEQGKDTRDIVQARYQRRFARRLRQVCARSDAESRSGSVRADEGCRQGINVGDGNVTHYSSSSSFGKCTVQSSSLNEIGRPSKIDSDLSAADAHVNKNAHQYQID